MNWDYKRLQTQADNEFLFVSTVLDKLLQNMADIKILDIGCSDGYETKKMFSKYNNIEVVGIDVSQDAIVKARSNMYSSNMFFECVDIESDNELMSFYEKYGKFDVIYCSHLVQHLKDAIEFIKKVHYFLLRPQGYFVIKTIDDSTKQASQQNEMLHSVLQYYQNYVAPFHELRRYTNRFIGNSMPTVLEKYYSNIEKYEYIQTTMGLSIEARLKLYDKCFHFRTLDGCKRKTLPCDKEYLDSLKRIRELFTKEDYVFSTTTLLFVAQNL